MKRIIGLLSFVVLIAGCAAPSEREPGWRTQVDNIHERHAGQDVNSIMITGTRTWYRGGYNSLVLQTRRDVHHLVTLTGPCDQELRFARDLRMRKGYGNRLSIFDSVTVGDRTCRIHRIRPIDMASVREEIAALDDDEVDDELSELQESGGT